MVLMVSNLDSFSGDEHIQLSEHVYRLQLIESHGFSEGEYDKIKFSGWVKEDEDKVA